MTKREARALAKARRTELDMQAVGCGMARALFALPCWAAADTVLAFAAMPDEPDTAAMLRRALADGKRLPSIWVKASLSGENKSAKPLIAVTLSLMACTRGSV